MSHKGNILRNLHEDLELLAGTAFSIVVWIQTRCVCFLGHILHFVAEGNVVDQRIEPDQVRRVLVVRLDEIGDIVLTTSFLRELRRFLPSSTITIVVKKGVRNLLELCPHVDEVLEFDQRTKRFLKPVLLPWRSFSFSRRYLRSPRFDLALLPRWGTDGSYASYLAYFSGARARLAYSVAVTPRKQLLNRGFDALFTHVIVDSNPKHEVEHNLDIIRYLGGSPSDRSLELWISEEDRTFAETTLQGFGVSRETTIIGFGPSSGHSVLKQWPLPRFTEVAKRIGKDLDCRFLIVGGSGEEGHGKEMEMAIGDQTINMVGKTTLRQLAALLMSCRVYVGNDAGPMHVAAAMGVPVVALFGSSCPDRFAPWGDHHSVQWNALPCSPCVRLGHADRCQRCVFDRPYCMLGITVDHVVDSISAVLGRLVQGRAGDPHKIPNDPTATILKQKG